MNLEEEARNFSSRKQIRSAPRMRGLYLSPDQTKLTISKLKDVKEGMRLEKICTSDPEKANLIQLAMDDTENKIKDYEQQLSILTEKQNGTRRYQYGALS